MKEDGSQVKVNETLDFKVIEFNKDSKRIILSHSRIHEDETKADGKLSFEGIPRIVFELFVAQRQTAVVLVDFQNLDFDGIADLLSLPSTAKTAR